MYITTSRPGNLHVLIIANPASTIIYHKYWAAYIRTSVFVLFTPEKCNAKPATETSDGLNIYSIRPIEFMSS